MQQYIKCAWLTVIILSSCGKPNLQPEGKISSSQIENKTEGYVAGKSFRNRPNSVAVDFLNETECEVREGRSIILAKYSLKDGKIRMVFPAGTVRYYATTENGIVEGDSAVDLFSRELVETRKFKEIEDAKAKAEKGDVDAQIYLGKAYSGEGGILPWSENDSRKWFQAAIDQGSAEAQVELSEVLLSRLQGYRSNVADGYDKYNAHKITALLLSASTKGLPKAWYLLGNMQARGVYVPVLEVAPIKNLTAAFESYRKASELSGGILGGVEIADAYFDGEGVPADKTKAFEIYERLAMQGIGAAQSRMVLCLVNGHGVLKDMIQAAAWRQIVNENSHGHFFNNRFRELDFSVFEHLAVSEAAKVSECRESLKSKISAQPTKAGIAPLRF